ncbi:MAG: purine biosynthesis protein PurH [Eubacterium sp.]|nr:purine biosynthesis protein PurH [Eubacterium sp.]
MASEKYLIRNTTEEERRKIVQESLGITDGLCDGCMQGIIDRYDAYIYGKMELDEVNASFHKAYGYERDDAKREEDEMRSPDSCAM